MSTSRSAPKRCEYCAFNTAPYREDRRARRASLARRSTPRSALLRGPLPWARAGHAAATVFLGGGTPSLLAADEHGRAARRAPRALRARARAPRSRVECNPESVTRDRLARLPRGGRDPDQPRRADARRRASCRGSDRLHTRRRRAPAFDGRARRPGFDNVSVDLIYGLPGLGPRRLGRAPSRACSTGSPTTSPPTRSRSTRAASGAPPASAGCRREDAVVGAVLGPRPRRRATRGFEHYEISNYARPGFRSRHNQHLLARRGIPGAAAPAPAASSATCATAT